MQPHDEAQPDPSPEIVGECPNCHALVGYADWLPLVGELGVMGCPRCCKVCEIDQVFPPVRP